MANYYLNDDGTLTKENKKKKGKNYILQEDGSLRLSQEDIAPVKTSASKRTWFNSGLFEDGLDFEDIPKTLLGTNVDFAEDLSSGLAGIGEGIIDTVATGVGAIAKKLGKDDFADKTQKFIERDLVNENKWDEKLASKIPGVETLQMANVVANKGDTEKVSVLGEKTDALVQSAGQLSGTYGLQAVGVPWWLTTGATSFGGGAEEAFQNDATYGEAGTYGLINAGAEIISEKLTGGIKFGGVALDEGLKKTLTKGISNKVAKTLVSLGWDAAGEGFEEVFSEVMTNIGKKLTYEKESTLDELLLSEDAMDAYLEAFIGGAVLGGGANVGKVAHSAKTGRDYDTGLTVNEQSVVDAEVKNRITERQKNVAVKEKIDQLITEQEKTFGTLSDSEKKRIKEQVQSQLEEIDYTTTKISKKEQTEIEKQVREDLEKGYIGIEQIESTLASGKTAEIKDLESQLTNTSDEVKKSEIQAKINQLKADRATQLTGALGKDTYLQESYRQEALKKKEFSREVKEEDSDITKELLESAKNSKMNDTRRMHDLFEYTNKIANDTGTKYGFVNNEQLKQLGHDVEGRTINGLVRVSEDGTTKVLINVDSEKALNTIIGHETTHLLEGTSEYKALQDIVKEYAITKGEYDSRLKQIQSLYEGTNANIENEITADLVGDYLFTDEQFINSLSTKQPNVFQKIYDYIKHAYKMATAGSQEARQLEQVKRRFDAAYRQMSKTTTRETETNLTTEADSNTKLSLTDNEGRELTKEQREYFKDSKVRDGEGSLMRVYHGTFDDFTVFNLNYTSNANDLGKGFYFTNKINDADRNYASSAGGDVQTKIENLAFELFQEKGYTEEDFYDNEYVEEYNKAYDEAEAHYSKGKTISAYLNLTNPLYASEYGQLYNSKGEEIDRASVEEYLKQGYDGIIDSSVKEKFPNQNIEKGTTHYVVFSPEQVKSVDNANPTNNPDIRYSLSGRDGEYMSAVERGDTETAQRLVDEAAKNAGYTIKAYHGSRQVFNEFSKDKRGGNTHTKVSNDWFFAADKETANSYYPYGVMKELARQSPNVWKDSDAEKMKQKGKLYNLYIKMENPLVVDVADYDYTTHRENADAWYEYTVQAEENGNDGIILLNAMDNQLKTSARESTVYMFKDPNQAKSADPITYDDNGNVIPLSERFNAKKRDIRFSLSSPVEENKNLMAIHNLHANEVLKQLDLGGMPMPSIAVTDPAKVDHEGFGDITLILDKDTIDPKKSKYNKVYSGDAYTPTFPRIEYEANEAASEAVYRTLTDATKGAPEDVRRNVLKYHPGNIDDELNRWGGETGLVESLLDDMSMKQTYLYTKGQYVEDISKTTEIKLTEEQKLEYDTLISELGEDTVRSLKAPVGENPIKHRQAWIKEHEREIRDAYKTYLGNSLRSDGHDITDGELNSIIEAETPAFFYKEVRAALNYLNNGDTTVKVEYDGEATRQEIENRIDESEYKQWLENLFKGIERKSGLRNNVDLFTPSGNRRSFDKLHDPVTLDNIVKAMRGDEQQKGQGFLGGNLSGAAAQEYGSIEDIKKDSGRIGKLTEEEHKQNNKYIEDTLNEIAMRYADGKDWWDARNALVEAVAMRETKNGIKGFLKEYDYVYKLDDSIVDDLINLRDYIRSLPVPYFEAKPQRAVGFDEVGVFVIPNNADAALKQKLLEAGYSIAEYNPDIEGDRQRVVNEFEKYKFSLSKPSNDIEPVNRQGNAYVGGYAVYGSDMKRLKEEIAPIREDIRDLKNTLSDLRENVAALAPEPTLTENTPNVEDIAPVRDDLTESDGLKNKIKAVEGNLSKEKKRLDDEYAKTLNPLKEEIKSKEEFISNKALNLYNELKGLKKGVRASDELSYLLDYGFSWNELKTSLLRVKAFPTSEVYSDSAVESIIRETLGREYEEKLYQVSEIEAEYKDAVEKVQKDTFETIRKLKEGKNEAEPEDLVTKTKKELRKQLLVDESDFFAKALDNAKNRSMILMNNTDTIRNTELVFGRENGKKINDLIFQKEIDNEAKSIAWQNKERAEIKDLGIKARSKESAAVQKWGEGKYVNEYGDEVEYTDADLMNEFPDVNTRQKIKNAANVIRGKYDNYIETANSVLTRLGFDPIQKRNDYMRHFQELSDVFSKYGIPFNAQHMKEYVLPTDINGLTEFWSPNKNYFANMQPRKGRRTTLDAITGIDGYISGVANLIYHTEDIQRGRAFEELIRDTYGEDKGWDNLENLPKEEQAARAEKIQDNHLSNYAAWVHEWTNNIAGKKNKLDRSFETMIGRKVFSFLDGTRKQTGANMIGFNASSALTNFIAPIQAMAKTNKLAVAKGTADTIKNIFTKDNFAEKNSFLTSRMGTDMLSKTAWQKIQDAGFVFMKGADWFAANQIVRSKYYELRSKGMSEEQAHAESGKFAARIMGDRTKGANAMLYNSKLFNIVGQFQLEVNNQLYSMFYDTYQESKENAQNNALRTAAGMTFTLGQLFAFTHVFGKTFESIAGYNPTFDIIGIIATALGVGDDDDDKTTSERLKDAADQLVDALPYVSALTGGGRIPITNAIPNLIGVATGGTDDYGNELTLGDELKKLIYLAPPTGGNQIKKTTQGLKMFDKDNPVPGSYTDSGNLRFPVEDTAINRIQAGIFGQWSNKNARDYFDNERQPLREKQIQEYKDLDLPIADYWEYREGLKDQKTVEDKFNYIADLDLPIDKKNIMINNAVDRDESIDLTNYDDFSSYEEFDYAIKNPEKYCLSRAVAKEFSTYKTYVSDLNDLRADKDSNGKTISGSRKEKVINYINGLNADYGEKIILFKSEYPADDTYNYEIIDYLNNRQDISYAEMETILKELGFQVDSNGNVRW